MQPRRYNSCAEITHCSSNRHGNCSNSGTNADKIVLKKAYNVYKDAITLEDYEIHDGFK